MSEGVCPRIHVQPSLHPSSLRRSDIDRLKNQLAEIQQSEDLALGELTSRRKEIEDLKKESEELKKELLVKDNEIMLIEQRLARADMCVILFVSDE